MQIATSQRESGVSLRQTHTADDASARATRVAPDLSPGGRILLSDAEAAELFGVSLRKFLELQTEPWFPQPVTLGTRLKRHIRSELEAAVRNMPRHDRPAEPAQLLRGKVEKLKRTGVPA